MSTTVRGNGTVQFTFFLVMKLNITIVTSCDSLILILVPNNFFVIKARKWNEETRPKYHVSKYIDLSDWL